MRTHTYRIIVVGDNKVGKSTFLKRHIYGEFEKEYLESFDDECIQVVFLTSSEEVRFNVCVVKGSGSVCPVRDRFSKFFRFILVFLFLTIIILCR